MWLVGPTDGGNRIALPALVRWAEGAMITHRAFESEPRSGARRGPRAGSGESRHDPVGLLQINIRWLYTEFVYGSGEKPGP